MVDEFERAIRDLEPGQRTGVFTTPFGFHIAELRGRLPGGCASFEEVREDIERVLTAMHEHRAHLHRIEELRCRAEIKWIPDSQEPDASTGI